MKQTSKPGRVLQRTSGLRSQYHRQDAGADCLGARGQTATTAAKKIGVDSRLFGSTFANPQRISW